MLPWLDEENIVFPSSELALDEPNGLLAAGGNLNADTLLQAYSLGLFPWFDDDSPILWWTPNPRMVVSPCDVHISKSMRKALRQSTLTVSCNKAFSEVMIACAKPRDYTDETWITDDMYHAYCELHAQGHAHSVEVWDGDKLVGGLYGITIGCVFFGESMFSRVTNASKIAFIRLSQVLLEWLFNIGVQYAISDISVQGLTTAIHNI